MSYNKNKSFGVCRSGIKSHQYHLQSILIIIVATVSLDTVCLRTLNAYFSLIVIAALEPLYEDEKYPENGICFGEKQIIRAVGRVGHWSPWA